MHTCWRLDEHIFATRIICNFKPQKWFKVALSDYICIATVLVFVYKLKCLSQCYLRLFLLFLCVRSSFQHTGRWLPIAWKILMQYLQYNSYIYLYYFLRCRSGSPDVVRLLVSQSVAYAICWKQRNGDMMTWWHDDRKLRSLVAVW